MFKFYIKAVAQEYSIYHSLTHTFIESVKTEKDLKSALKKWNGKSEEELWMFLLDVRYARVPKKNFEGKDKFFDDNDKQYEEAWSIFTKRFFSRYKGLAVMQEEIPYELIRNVQVQRDQAQKEKMERERIEGEARLKKHDEEEQARKAQLKEEEEMARRIPEKKRKKIKVKKVKGKKLVLMDL
ncbi:hypothetical protein F400_gp001 [Bacillus phage BCD7]|uniref:Uncharacterized protein n=1 Tax=Bacillus phage BCD7 TaxID=1136534 RepID=J9PTW8_9CAUD|nr:hypothetical protein F400_gp001 [Bacillus phage BCD7]AEZ50448.1 hypothetical protein BCD7_0001 [Bacillus phage BCD7]